MVVPEHGCFVVVVLSGFRKKKEKMWRCGCVCGCARVACVGVRAGVVVGVGVVCGRVGAWVRGFVNVFLFYF